MREREREREIEKGRKIERGREIERVCVSSRSTFNFADVILQPILFLNLPCVFSFSLNNGTYINIHK